MAGGTAMRLLAAVACVMALSAACSKSDGGGTSGGGGGSSISSAPTTTSEGTGPTGPTGSTGSTGATGPAPAADLAGTWNGTWANSTPDTATGTFVITWTQDGTKLAGTITIEGTPCLTGGSITGKVRGSSINFGVVQGQVEVNYAGTFKGDTMSGTYATSCGNANGDWEASRTG